MTEDHGKNNNNVNENKSMELNQQEIHRQQQQKPQQKHGTKSTRNPSTTATKCMDLNQELNPSIDDDNFGTHWKKGKADLKRQPRAKGKGLICLFVGLALVGKHKYSSLRDFGP
jgi:hypothetical protein